MQMGMMRKIESSYSTEDFRKGKVAEYLSTISSFDRAAKANTFELAFKLGGFCLWFCPYVIGYVS